MARTMRKIGTVPPLKSLAKEAKRGFRGYPIATVAFYGPNDRFASKMVVGIIPGEQEEAVALEKWFSEGTDIRMNPEIAKEAIAFVKQWDAKSVAMVDGIIGCPHEEGIDYDGPVCPSCPFWANRDRWTGQSLG